MCHGRVISALIALAFLPAGLAGADDKPAQPITEPIKVIKLERKEPVTYYKEIAPILAKKCGVCHTGKDSEGDFDLSSYDKLMKGNLDGPVIVPGKSADSQLVKLAGKTAKPTMPPKKETPLTPEELALIKLWVDQGAKGGPAKVSQRDQPRIIVAALPAGVHPVRSLAVHSGKAAVAAGRGNQIHFFDGATGNYLRSLLDPALTTPDSTPIKAAHRSTVEALAFSPDGKLLASGSFQEVIIWDVDSGTIKHRLTGFADRVLALAFSSSGKYLAAGGGAPAADGEIKIYEMPSARLVTDIKNGHSDTVFGISFSPDGTRLATCAADKLVKVFEVPGGKFLKSLEGHTHHVLDVAWKADGKLLASAGADHVVKIWDFEKGEQIRTINAHAKQVMRLIFIGNSPQFLTCSPNQTVKWWNADNGAVVRTLPGASGFLCALAANADGSIVVAGNEEGQIRLYNGIKGQLVKALVPPEK